jgi:hypothetical protein
MRLLFFLEMGKRGRGKGEREILDCFIDYESLKESEDSRQILP